MSPTIAKSSRHAKITGDFAEHLILYWLSKHGFECARVDHVGMDLIARREGTLAPMGISVKARSRLVGTESTTLNIPRDNADKLVAACQAFGCEPWFAIVVDAGSTINSFLMSLETLSKTCSPKTKLFHWRMKDEDIALYSYNPDIFGFSLQSAFGRWWPSDAVEQTGQ